MPQVIFEHSSNLNQIDFKNLFEDIYTVIKKLPNVGTCKIRAVSVDNYYIGTSNGENAFAYLKLLMKPRQERTASFRENLAHDLMPIIQKYLEGVKNNNGIKCYPTIEVGLTSEQYYFVLPCHPE